VQRRDFSYDLPAELIAQVPLAERSASRLLVLERDSGRCHDRCMRDLPQLLAPGDVLVVNDTKVVSARLIGHKPTGGRVELFLERPVEANTALVMLRASKPVRSGVTIATAGGEVQVLEPRDELWLVRLPQPALAFFGAFGAVPLPPYIRRQPDAADRERYQSIFAHAEGAVAAPTASLHFDTPLLAELERQGIARTSITLHVGAGTFQPLRAEDLGAHVMHAERVSVGAEACAAIAQARARGGRVIAVGTTVVRALEAAWLEHQRLAPWSGETELFIRPGFRFRIVDGLITNFHLPESTLLMLVCAFAGREAVLAAYAHAVRSRYRFFSYGDAMLLTPAPATDATTL
jgi:S-adenosylmethionine:tRNA ribosyltransferase-isomerase